MDSYMVWIWLAVFILMIVIEASTASLVTVWFAIGAIVAMILSIIPDVPFWVEIVVFVAVSTVVLVLLRPLVKKLLGRSEIKSNADEIIGRRATVVHPITDIEYGAVKLNGVIWTAMNTDSHGGTISTGSIVEILAISGNKLVVKLIKSSDSDVITK